MTSLFQDPSSRRLLRMTVRVIWGCAPFYHKFVSRSFDFAQDDSEGVFVECIVMTKGAVDRTYYDDGVGLSRMRNSSERDYCFH